MPITGSLVLGVERRTRAGTESSVVSFQRHSGALRSLRPLYPDDSGQVNVMTVNPGGGYLGGDRYELDARLGDDSELLLTTQSATKVYRSQGRPTHSLQRFELGRGSRLEFVPDSLIAYRGATYHQRTEVTMHPEASIALTDIVTHGWSPDGTQFAFDEVGLRTRVVCEDRPLVTDALLLRPAEGATRRLMLGGFSHLATLLVVNPHADDDAVADLRELLGVRRPRATEDEPLLGITRLRRPGFLLRALTHSTPGAERVLHNAINWMRARWYGQPPLVLRKP